MRRLLSVILSAMIGVIVWVDWQAGPVMAQNVGPSSCKLFCPNDRSASSSYGISSFWAAREWRKHLRARQSRRSSVVPANIQRSRNLADSALNLLHAGTGENQLIEAIRLLRLALREDPRDSDNYIHLNLIHAKFHLGVKYAQRGEFEGALPLIREAANRLPSRFGEALKELEPFVEQTRGIRDAASQAKSASPEVVPDYALSERRRLKEKRRERLTRLKPAEPVAGASGVSDASFGITGSVPEKEAGLVKAQTGGYLPSHDKRVGKQRDSAVYHGSRAKSQMDKGAAATAHHEASRPFDRSGKRVPTPDVAVPPVAGTVIIAAQGAADSVPKKLRRQKRWQKLREQEMQIREELAEQRARIARLRTAYTQQKSAGDSKAPRTLVKIALEKQKEKNIVDGFASVRQKQREMFETFMVDVRTPIGNKGGADTKPKSAD